VREIVFHPELHPRVAFGQELDFCARVGQQARLDQLAPRHPDLAQPRPQLAVVEQRHPHRRFGVERRREQTLGFPRGDRIDVAIGHGGQAVDGGGRLHVAHVVRDRRGDAGGKQAEAQPVQRIASTQTRAISGHGASPEPCRNAGRCPVDRRRRRDASGRRNGQHPRRGPLGCGQHLDLPDPAPRDPGPTNCGPTNHGPCDRARPVGVALRAPPSSTLHPATAVPGSGTA
jgi:hypothetical protein